MSGILQQGYSCGYVFAACANLGVGGETNSWKTVFWIAAGLSIGVGVVRMAFPESQQFRQRKEDGHKEVTPAVFWQETRGMLAKEWKMCVYCIILMTWFNYVSSLFPRLTSRAAETLTRYSKVFAHIARQLHHLYVDAEGSKQQRRIHCQHPHEDRCLRRRNHHWISIAMDRSSPGNGIVGVP